MGKLPSKNFFFSKGKNAYNFHHLLIDESDNPLKPFSLIGNKNNESTFEEIRNKNSYSVKT